MTQVSEEVAHNPGLSDEEKAKLEKMRRDEAHL
jgi:hypothetical protein